MATFALPIIIFLYLSLHIYRTIWKLSCKLKDTGLTDFSIQVLIFSYIIKLPIHPEKINSYSKINNYSLVLPHSSTLAWQIPWTEEPGGLQSMGSQRVRHNWATSLFTFMHRRRKWQPTPVFLPGESQGRGAWWAAVYGVAQSWTRLKQLSSSSRGEKAAGSIPDSKELLVQPTQLAFGYVNRDTKHPSSLPSLTQLTWQLYSCW